MARDPYSVLGVSKSADEKTIRDAYRQLAKKYHPDRNPDNKQAEDKFKAASAAFDIVGDKEKRAKYDRGEIGPDGNPRGPFAGGGGWQGGARGGPHQANGGYGPGAGQGRHQGYDDIGDIFSDIFGGGAGRGQGPMQGRDVRYRMDVEFAEAATGVTKRVTMPDGKTLNVTIPEGLRDGQTLRLRGQGEPGFKGGPAGDVYVEVTVRPHRFFEVEGDNVMLEVPVTLSEAVLGAKIVVPTVHGDVSVGVPRGTSSGASLRLKGKGLKNAKTGNTGDQIVRLKIVLPETTDEEFEQFIASWQGDKDQNPRARMKA
ncbi:J domain-containing protein [Parvularcula sp. IMCC14364]|uniref:J domain-containing protein n=1 Tax=Parvularcula sp. IMCC14364 TaxID=3067902 RepID=UPI002741B2E8|nr:J domain-containing protein [Parvularcula sp. IMCC14364]